MIIGHRGRFLAPVRPRLSLDALNLFNDRVERRRHDLVHLLGIAAFDKIGRVAVASEELLQFLDG